MLDCTNKGIINKDKGVIIALYSVLVKPHLEYSCALLVPAKQNRCGQAGEGPEKGYKDNQRIEKLKCEKWLRDPGLFSLEKEGFGEDVTSMFQYLKGAYREDGDSILTRSCVDKKKCNEYKLLLGTNFLLNSRKTHKDNSQPLE